MSFRQSRLEVRRGFVFGVGLMRAPFHKEAVGQPSEHSHDPHPLGVANATAVVVVRNIQALVQAVFDAAKTCAVEAKPGWSVQFVGGGVGEQADQLIFAIGRLAQQARGLGDQGEADRLGRDGLGSDGSALDSTSVNFQRAELVKRRLVRGENPRRAREPVSRYFLGRSVDCP